MTGYRLQVQVSLTVVVCNVHTLNESFYQFYTFTPEIFDMFLFSFVVD